MDAVLASSSGAASLRAPAMRGAASLASSSQDLRLGALPLRLASAAAAPESTACARRSAPGSCRAEAGFPLGPIFAAAAAASSQGGLTYKDSGVDIDAGNELVKRIAKMTPGIGGFGGVFPFGDHYLVAGTDGCGTKLKVAFEMNLHDTIGIDLVAMSVNDIITLGAKPLFFLDYFASSKLDIDQASNVIQGIVNGCKESDCALLGGETAEMPGFYKDGEYDLSGFAVGAVKKTDLIDGSTIAAGDIILGLPSSGLHSNGFSLARKIVEVSGAGLHDPLPGTDTSIGRALLAPTKLYVRQVLALLEGGGVKGMAHITGGGFTENIPRVLPKGIGAEITEGSWEELPIFGWLRKAGNVSEEEMRRVFNLGIGMILVVSPERAEQILATGDSTGGPILKIGRTVEGEGVTFTS